MHFIHLICALGDAPGMRVGSAGHQLCCTALVWGWRALTFEDDEQGVSCMVMRLDLHGDCSRGVDLVRAEYVPDDEQDIGSTVLRLKERVGPGGFVFTSGGIGATHDDVTYSAIAAAFGAPAAGGSTKATAPAALAENTLLCTATQHLHPTMDAGIWRNALGVLLGWQGTSTQDAVEGRPSQVCCIAGTELQLHEPTVERMRENCSKRGVELNEARLRMATLPAAAEVMHAIYLCTQVCICSGTHEDFCALGS